EYPSGFVLRGLHRFRGEVPQIELADPVRYQQNVPPSKRRERVFTNAHLNLVSSAHDDLGNAYRAARHPRGGGGGNMGAGWQWDYDLAYIPALADAAGSLTIEITEAEW